MPHTKILLVQSDVSLGRLIATRLEGEGFDVTIESDAAGALRALHQEMPDLVVIDLRVRGDRGLELRTLVRQKSSTLPILLLSPTGRELDAVADLHLGLDDFMTSPYRVHDLVLRLKGLLRSEEEREQSKILRVGSLELDLIRYQARVGGAPLKLTTKEFELLRALIEAKGRVLRREYIMETVWGYRSGSGVETRTLDVHIRRLRKKLRGEGHRILTLRNVGHRMEMAAENLRMVDRAEQ